MTFVQIFKFLSYNEKENWVYRCQIYILFLHLTAATTPSESTILKRRRGLIRIYKQKFFKWPLYSIRYVLVHTLCIVQIRVINANDSAFLLQDAFKFAASLGGGGVKMFVFEKFLGPPGHGSLPLMNRIGSANKRFMVVLLLHGLMECQDKWNRKRLICHNSWLSPAFL